jgi:exopolyphosphatase/pppGpp-phosphohydrolase
LKDKICGLNSHDRHLIKGIPAERIDIMPAALLTICVLADLTKAEAFYLTHHGVRQGMIELLKSEEAITPYEAVYSNLNSPKFNLSGCTNF